MKVKNLIEKAQWQWKVIEYLSYILIFVTPLYFVSSQWFPFSTSKIVFTTLCVILMLTTYSFWLISSNKVSIRITPVHIVLLFFLIALTISSIFGIDIHNSFFGTFSQSVNMILIYVLSIFSFFVSILVVNNKSFLKNIILSSFLSSIIVSMVSYTGSSLSKILLKGSTIGNSSYVGGYLLFNICFGLGLFFYYKKYWNKFLIFIGTIIIALSPYLFNKDILNGKISLQKAILNPILLLGEANGAIIGIIIAVVVSLCFYLMFSHKKILKGIGFISIISVLFCLVYVNYSLVKPNSEIHKVYVEKKTENRFIAWDSAKINFIHHPVLGSGFNNYYYVYEKNYNPLGYKIEFPEFWFNQPHNVFWEFASNNGILGLVLYLSLLVFSVFAFYLNGYKKENKILRAIFIGIIFGYFIQNLFVFDTLVTYLMLFLIIGIAMGISEKYWTVPNINKMGVLKSVAVITIIGSLASIIIFVYLPAKESSEWQKLGSNSNIRKFINLREGIQETSVYGGILDSAYMGDELWFLYRKNLSLVDKETEPFFIKEIDSLINQIEKDLENQPNHARAYMVISKLLILRSSFDMKMDDETYGKINDNIHKAILIYPYNPKIYVILSEANLIKRDFPTALLNAKKAIEVNPYFKESYTYGRNIMEIKKDKDFEKYLNDMESQWIKK